MLSMSYFLHNGPQQQTEAFIRLGSRCCFMNAKNVVSRSQLQCYIHHNLRKYTNGNRDMLYYSSYHCQKIATTRFMTYCSHRHAAEQQHNTLLFQSSRCYKNHRNHHVDSSLSNNKSQWMKKETSSNMRSILSSTSDGSDVETEKSSDEEIMGDRLVSLQKEISSNNKINDDNKKSNNIVESAETIHIQHQQQVFDNLVSYFTSDEAVPVSLIPVYEYTTKRIFDTIEEHHINNKMNAEDTNSTSISDRSIIRILDVGCGTGVLWEFLSNEANKRRERMTLHITGIDLTNGMVMAANNKATVLQEKYSGTSNKHTFNAIQGDIATYQGHISQVAVKLNDDNNSTTANNDLRYYYDAIIMNACFGNFYNPKSVLDNISKHLIHDNSLVFITHPLGGQFVNKLHNEDPITVPHTLPINIYNWFNLSIGLPYELLNVSTNDIKLDNDISYPFYFLSAIKTRATMLSDNIMKFRGNIDTGYGRGGKKLGFPTANLPSSLFQESLRNVSNGVYFGYAIIEDNVNQPAFIGRNIIHPVVVNIGYSPTFVGKENIEKIIEAHIILDDKKNIFDPPDFYNETMRLVLLGFLRYEMKFGSFPELIQQIQNDVIDAKHALTSINMPYVYMKQNDPFLEINDKNIVICLANGTLDASYEFESTQTIIRKLQDMWNQHS